MVRRFQLHWIIFGLIFPTGISAIYGIMQSYGYDFMHWSQDPTGRVFACINNPVHYCAYVGMIVPLCLGWILYLAKTPKSQTQVVRIGKWVILFFTALIFYTQLLSFSRATWVGFMIAMPLFYLMVSDQLNASSEKRFIIDFFMSAFGIFSLYLLFLFKVYEKSFFLAAPFFIFIIGYLLYSVRSISQEKTGKNDDPITSSDIVIGGTAVAIIIVNYLFNLTALYSNYMAITHILLSVYFVSVCMRVTGKLRIFIARLVTIMLFTRLQFVALSWLNIFLYGTLIVSYYFIALKDNSHLIREKKFWLLGFLCLFGVVIITPTLPVRMKSIKNLITHQENTASEHGLKAITTVEAKLGRYNVSAEANPRISMWKSAIPWTLDHLLLGTGPDTIKYMYPKYRRPEYGILEGGHNYTPDRLHNEYVNTLASKGLLGFASYYLILIIGWFLLYLRGFYRFSSNPNRYIIAGFGAGVIVYLGQVLFNFGVVATLFLFYVYMGLTLAITQHPSFQNED
ncbi:MAG: hypothetical protein ACI9BD_000126 [Candidatus Marinamargulisbacteria bacterium]